MTGTITNEDTQSTAGLVITRNPVDGASVTHFKITGISGGTLYQNDGVTAIANGAFISAAQGLAGLKFTPSQDSTASGKFDVQASTAASDAGLGGAVQTAVITVNPVDDAPILTLGGERIAGLQRVDHHRQRAAAGDRHRTGTGSAHLQGERAAKRGYVVSGEYATGHQRHVHSGGRCQRTGSLRPYGRQQAGRTG